MPSRTVRAVAMTENSHRKKKMKFDAAVMDSFADALAKAGYLLTEKTFEQSSLKLSSSRGKGTWTEGGTSISRAIRGLAAMEGKTVVEASRDEDISYARKTLLTGTTPGSYLVPTIQADQIIQLLTSANAFRQAGARIWPMANIQK